MIGVLLVVLGITGWALEVAHLVFFWDEPVVVWTKLGEPAPILLFGGQEWPTAWKTSPDGDRLRWEADLAQAPLGVWLVCTADCFAFLRVSRDVGLVEVWAAPEGAQIELSGEMRVVNSRGTAFFLIRPGEHDLTFTFLGHTLQKPVRLGPGERLTLTFLSGSARPTSALVLPEKRVGLNLTVTSLLLLPYLRPKFLLPPGWEVEADPAALDPVPAGVPVTRRWLLRVPAEASPGSYRIVARVLWLEITATIQVEKRLPPLVVVGHWDINRNEIDLTSPFGLTYARVLWAASLLGKPIPYTGKIMTSELLAEILQVWASSLYGNCGGRGPTTHGLPLYRRSSS